MRHLHTSLPIGVSHDLIEIIDQMEAEGYAHGKTVREIFAELKTRALRNGNNEGILINLLGRPNEQSSPETFLQSVKLHLHSQFPSRFEIKAEGGKLVFMVSRDLLYELRFQAPLFIPKLEACMLDAFYSTEKTNVLKYHEYKDHEYKGLYVNEGNLEDLDAEIIRNDNAEQSRLQYEVSMRKEREVYDAVVGILGEKASDRDIAAKMHEINQETRARDAQATALAPPPPPAPAVAPAVAARRSNEDYEARLREPDRKNDIRLKALERNTSNVTIDTVQLKLNESRWVNLLQISYSYYMEPMVVSGALHVVFLEKGAEYAEIQTRYLQSVAEYMMTRCRLESAHGDLPGLVPSEGGRRTRRRRRKLRRKSIRGRALK